ncbi:MAG: hypothetical protein ACU85E_13195 [Gammaproteobacteria bacterium]
MKTTTTKQYAATIISLFIVFTIFSLITQVRSSYAETDNSKLFCQESQRGIRCADVQSDDNFEFTPSQIDRLLTQIEEFCSTTSRGMRCINKSDNVVMVTPNDDRPAVQERSNCSMSVRGLRCGETLS